MSQLTLLLLKNLSQNGNKRFCMKSVKFEIFLDAQRVSLGKYRFRIQKRKGLGGKLLELIT